MESAFLGWSEAMANKGEKPGTDKSSFADQSELNSVASRLQFVVILGNIKILKDCKETLWDR